MALAVSFALQSCARFSKVTVVPGASETGYAERLAGRYNVLAEGDTFSIDFNNAFQKFYRGKGRHFRDTIALDSLQYCSFQIDFPSERQMQLTYLKRGLPVHKYTLRYRYREDGCVYVKNKNFKVIGLPYLLGGVDVRRLRLRMDGELLVIDEVHHSSGALLFVIGDAKTWRYSDKYRRIV